MGWRGSFKGGRGRGDKSENWEKAHPGALNEIRTTGEVEQEEETEGFVGV